MHAAIVPIVGGGIAISIGSYLAGVQKVFSTTSVLLAALALTVLAALIWRMPKGAPGFVEDAAASLLIIGYVPMLGAFTALMLAEEQGGARLVTFLLVVTMSDTGGYVGGVLFGKHPMAPKISPKKSWEGFAGSMVFGITAGVLMAVFGLQVPFWVGPRSRRLPGRGRHLRRPDRVHDQERSRDQGHELLPARATAE